MKVNDYDIKIDTSQFFDKESVQRWVDKAVDINEYNKYKESLNE